MIALNVHMIRIFNANVILQYYDKPMTASL